MEKTIKQLYSDFYLKDEDISQLNDKKEEIVTDFNPF